MLSHSAFREGDPHLWKGDLVAAFLGVTAVFRNMVISQEAFWEHCAKQDCRGRGTPAVMATGDESSIFKYSVVKIQTKG